MVGGSRQRGCVGWIYRPEGISVGGKSEASQGNRDPWVHSVPSPLRSTASLTIAVRTISREEKLRIEFIVPHHHMLPQTRWTGLACLAGDDTVHCK